MNRHLPVTLVGGFLGAGKTSLLHYFISEHRSGNLAILVENPGALNIDGQAYRGLCGAMRRFHDAVLEIPNCDEVSQIKWIADRLHEFSKAGRFERVLIEVSGTSTAARLGRHFGLLPGQSGEFKPWAELHQIVSVVDALDFYRTMVVPFQSHSSQDLLDFQRAQIEDANLLVLNKCDLIGDDDRAAARRLLREINPHAQLFETAYGEIPPEVLARSGTLQEFGVALDHPPRFKAGNGLDLGMADPYLSSTLYRAYRPFHPERFWNWYEADHPGLWRVKGLIWLATRNLLVGGVSRTRWENACGCAGIWWAALPREEWPEDSESLTRMQETWREPYGDRRQELILIGNAEQLVTITQQLNSCFLTAEEYSRPVEEWSALPDPFPAWDVGED